MKYVEPIRDPEEVRDISMHLKKTSKRNHIMFFIGIYSGLRISDILRLKVIDVKNKDSISLKEKKTGKQKTFAINPILKKEIKNYCKDKELSEYLIVSREGNNKPLSREMAYKILRDVGETFDLYNLGTHTMRKTFGYHHYKQYKDIVILQKIFNHSTPYITLKYIGIEQDTINNSINNFKIY